MNEKRAVLIYSGGLDSTVLLYHLRERGYEVIALGVDYGQRHVRELAAAERITKRLGVSYETVDLSGIGRLLAGSGSSQVDPGSVVPEGHYAAENMKATVVPNRNMIMLAVAAGHAIAKRAGWVVYGAHRGDHEIYPDCRKGFVDALGGAIALADWHPVQLMAPFVDRTKAELVTLGAKLAVPFGDTWSCYKGLETHCGRCGTCVERKEAFAIARVEDPTEYGDSEFGIPAFRKVE